MAQQQIQIPERRDDEPPASPQQLQRIRQLTTGQSLQGYRFDYRKLGATQADTILNQLQAINDQQPAPTKPKKQGPGCIASLAKGTTALLVWLVVLAGVAGGAYLIYWQMKQNPKTSNQASQGDADQETPKTTDQPDNNRSTSKIFEGLGTSDPPTPTPPTNPTPDRPNIPDTDLTPSDPKPDPTPAIDRAATKQLEGLEKILVTISQGTRQSFAPNVRIQSSQAMQLALDNYPQALAILKQTDPTLPPRIRAIIDAFAADEIDGPALRDEIKPILKIIKQLKNNP